MGKIERSIDRLSPNDRLVGQRLLSAYPSAAWETIEQISQSIGVSKSAVVRFASRLGYDGFGELQRELQEELAELMASPLRLLAERQGTDGKNILDRTVKVSHANLEATSRWLSSQALHELAERIANAERVFVIGMRKSFGVAVYAHHLLDSVISSAELIRPDGSYPNSLLDVGSGHVVVALTSRRYASATYQAVRHSKESGAYVAVITDTVGAPANPNADTVLIAASDGVSLFDSAVSTVFIIEALTSVVVSLRSSDAEDRLRRSEALLRRFAIHHSSGD